MPAVPTPSNSPFQPVAGNHNSILMSESLLGLNVAVTRQNAGRLLSAAAAASPPPAGLNAPAATDWADVIVAFFSETEAKPSHDAAAAATRPNTTIASRTYALLNMDRLLSYKRTWGIFYAFEIQTATRPASLTRATSSQGG